VFCRIFVFLTFFFVSHTHGNDIVVRHISVEQGLPQSSVNDIYQDPKGFVWMATDGGLVRYDSNEFRVFNPTNTPQLREKRVLKIEKESDLSFFIAGESTLFRFDTIGDTFETLNLNDIRNQYSDFTIIDLAYQDSSLWMLVINRERVHLFKMQSGSDEFTPVTASTEFLSKHNYSLLSDINGSVFVHSDANNYWVDQQSLNLQPMTLPRAEGATTDVYLKTLTGDVQYIGAEYKWCFKKQDLTPCGRHYFDHQYMQQFSGERPTLLIQQYDSESYWLGVYGAGVFKLDDNLQLVEHFTADSALNRITELPTTKSLTNNDINDLLIDDQKNVWLSTYGMGINFISRNAINMGLFRALDDNESLSNPHVRSFYYVSDEEVWVGTFDGLNKVNLQTGLVERYLSPAGNKTSRYFVREIIPFDEQNLLVLFADNISGSPLWLFNVTSKKWKRFSVPDGLTPSGGGFTARFGQDLLWLSTVTDGVFTYDAKTESWQRPQWLNGHVADHIQTIYFDEDGSVWLGGLHGGLRYHFESKTLQIFGQNTHPSLSSDWVRSFLHDQRNRLWMGTNAGLYTVVQSIDSEDELNGSSPSKLDFEVVNKLAKETIYGILEDQDGVLWLSTNSGIIAYHPYTDTIQRLDINDGLQGLEFNTGAFLKTANEKLFFGGTQGFNYFQPRHMFTPQIEPLDIVITDLRILNQSLTVGQNVLGLQLEKAVNEINELTLQHFHEFFSIDFTLLDFSQSKDANYQYRVSDISDAWVEIEQNRAYFTGLADGTYTIELRAVDYSGNVLGQRQISVFQKAPWWRSTNALLMYVLLFSLFTFTLYWRRLERHRKQNERLQQAVDKRTLELNLALREKDHIFNHVSHEFRTPLTLINGITDNLINDNPDSKSTSSLASIKYQSNYLLRLVNQLLGLSRLDANDLDMGVEVSDTSIIIEQLLVPFLELCEQNQVKLEWQLEEHLHCVISQHDIAVIVNNLMSNAIKFTPSGGRINVSFRREDNRARLLIQDTGTGLSKEVLKHLWQPFYKGENAYKNQYFGTGLGLSLVKKTVHKHAGKIDIRNAQDKGCIAECWLPVKAKAVSTRQLKNIDLKDTELELDYLLPDETILDTQNELAEKHASILIVEDHSKLAQFIVNELSDTYHCYRAVDGSEGCALALKYQPDVIISDVMMPKMDGVEMCGVLKSDPATSHIPIIMLTAKSDHSSKLLGLQQKANLYMSKPFDMNELRLNVTNFVEDLNQLKEYYKQGILTEFGVNEQSFNKEKQFTDKLFKVLDEKFSGFEFDATHLASELSISEKQLQRKLKALIGSTPTQYIRTWRLNKSKMMLLKGQPVGNVAFDCGFNNQAYFSKCFKQEFGQTPTDFLSKSLP
jgi:signal transduction histidine kinase/DNA-binding response OmpR family regulator/streptogramin lyase